MNAQTWVWEGTYNVDWSFGPNWDLGIAPSPNADVQIYSNSNGINPTVIGTKGCKSIIIFDSASLSIAPGSSLSTTGSIGVNGQTSAFFNRGTFINNGDLIIGTASPSSPGTIPFWNVAGSVSNSSNATIKISKADLVGIVSQATFSNSGSIIIGEAASPNMQVGLQLTEGTFTNNYNGNIEINRSTSTPVFISNSSSLVNSGDIYIGNNQASGNNGLEIGASATLTNDIGGKIEIDDVLLYGILNTGTAINKAEIDIKSGDCEFSLVNTGTFTNTAEGVINFNMSADQMNLFNTDGGTFNNNATLNFGQLGNIASRAIQNQATFNNQTSGEINIDRTSEFALVNILDFTNNGEINMGDLAAIGQMGINNLGNFSNSSGHISINRASNRAMENTGTFDNVTSSSINIGSSNTSGSFGIVNAGTFSNGSSLTINRVTSSGISNLGGGTFTNGFQGNIRIGNVSLSASNGIENAGTFSQTSFGSSIEINGTSNIAFLTSPSSTTSIAGLSDLKIGNTSNSGIEGIVTQDDFTSNGNISINRVTTTGFRSTGGTTNIAGGSLKVGDVTGTVDYGVDVSSTFTVGTNADIEINRFTEAGLYNSSTGSLVINGDLRIGNGVSSGRYGIHNLSDITVNATGNIEINKTINNAIRNLSSGTSLTNFGTIHIGNNTGTGQYGIYNTGLIDNESSGEIFIDRTSINAIYNASLIRTDGDINMGATSANTGVDILNEAGGVLEIQSGNVIVHE
ncbi:hypothetical protein GCM10007940_06150 [Portibacter lacus]|uniref:Uncharacterized protein n=2 Tax=Portibacter lacus TaxID=1099794 RepID=A0AA37SL85_9BACT|nr:hypothetical protein GCM10007940_06150 [Portibacter lacus]